MTEEELNEALNIRDEYIHVSNHCKNEPWFTDLNNEAKNGTIEGYMNLCEENEVDEAYSYYIWMYNRGPFREEKQYKSKLDPIDESINASHIKFMNFYNTQLKNLTE